MPRKSPPKSSRIASRQAAPSLASTASASTRKATCRRCSRRTISTRCSSCDARSTPPASATPEKCFRRLGSAARYRGRIASIRPNGPVSRNGSDLMSVQVIEPIDAAGVAAALSQASASGRSVVVRGAGTKLASRPSDVILSTARMTQGVDHVAGDLVATLPAGISLEAANEILRREGQWLPLDPPRSERATIGGIVATNDSGPRRHRFGAPRDLIIGIEIALVDGRVAKAGGRVVKNVAGYDLSKLMCGSLGTLAVVTSATFKLSPVAPSSRTLVASLADLRRLSTLALTLANTPSI